LYHILILIKFSHVGENISLTCNFSSLDATATAWFKQIPGEKPLRIVSAFRAASVEFDNGFDKRGRFIALREANKFTLNITNAETSDSAIYYCSVAAYASIGLGACTVLVLEGTPPVSNPIKLGGNTSLECSILTNRCSEDHSVYWFRQGSGESDPGIIFTHGNRSDQCKKSSETVSPTQSCIYKLPKNNLSLSDAGTYYCAVAACGEILFGNGTKLDFTGGKIRYFNIEVIGGHEIFSHMKMDMNEMYVLTVSRMMITCGLVWCHTASCGEF
uniref:Ig-like domain-containing protein n=1 Tax=Astyanax mexicanus TaxID=7994 RepID=A0A8B9GVK8_ASTMX